MEFRWASASCVCKQFSQTQHTEIQKLSPNFKEAREAISDWCKQIEVETDRIMAQSY